MNKKPVFLILIIILLIILMNLLMGGCSNDSEDKTKVIVSEFRAISWCTAHLAYELGYFEDEGLDVSFAIYKDGPNAIQGLHSNASQFCLIGQGPIFLAYDEGLESEILLSVKQNRPFCIVANPNINELSQLKGKTVFAGLPGSEPYLLVCYALEKAGLNPEEDVNFINLDYGASLVALGEGHIDASYFGIEYKEEFSKIDSNILLDTSDPVAAKDFFGTEAFTTDVICCTKEYSNSNPETVQAFVNAILKALDWMNNHSSYEIAEVIAPFYETMSIEEINTKISLLKDSFSINGQISEESYDAVADFFSMYNIPKNRIHYNDVINMTYIEKANK